MPPLRSETTYTCARKKRSSFYNFIFFTSNAESLTMDIVTAKRVSDPPLLKFKIGGAAFVFEAAEKWKHDLQSLLVSCNI
jgi:hypothetical protein